jgi:hypothetical protein
LRSKVFQGKVKVEVDDLVVRRGKQTTFALLPYLLVFLVCDMLDYITDEQ